jgi:hypothetical protein
MDRGTESGELETAVTRDRARGTAEQSGGHPATIGYRGGPAGGKKEGSGLGGRGMHLQEKQGEFPRTLALNTPGGPDDLTSTADEHGPDDISLRLWTGRRARAARTHADGTGSRSAFAFTFA